MGRGGRWRLYIDPSQNSAIVIMYIVVITLFSILSFMWSTEMGVPINTLDFIENITSIFVLCKGYGFGGSDRIGF
jgi:hypothetical protein